MTHRTRNHPGLQKLPTPLERAETAARSICYKRKRLVFLDIEHVHGNLYAACYEESDLAQDSAKQWARLGYRQQWVSHDPNAKTMTIFFREITS